MVLLLLACVAPEATWPGLVLLDPSAADEGVRFLEPAAVLRTTDDSVVIDAIPETLDAEAGELVWITAEDGELDFEGWTLGEELDPERADLYTVAGVRPELPDSFGAAIANTHVDGAWRVEAPELLLLLATHSLPGVEQIVPVWVEEPDGPVVALAGGATGVSGRAPGIGRHTSSTPHARNADGSVSTEVSDTEGITTEVDPAEMALRSGEAAAYVGLHEQGELQLILAADGTWRAGLDEGALSGRWWIEGGLVLEGERNTVVLPAEDGYLDIAAGIIGFGGAR